MGLYGRAAVEWLQSVCMYVQYKIDQTPHAQRMHQIERKPKRPMESRPCAMSGVNSQGSLGILDRHDQTLTRHLLFCPPLSL